VEGHVLLGFGVFEHVCGIEIPGKIVFEQGLQVAVQAARRRLKPVISRSAPPAGATSALRWPPWARHLHQHTPQQRTPLVVDLLANEQGRGPSAREWSGRRPHPPDPP